jgi:hypothetical protein
MFKPKKNKKQGTGSYIAFKSGNVFRSYPGEKFGSTQSIPTESIDTTGFSKGKKNFKLKKGVASFGSTGGTSMSLGSENVPRNKVKSLLNAMKKGASRMMDLRTKEQRQAARNARKVKYKF